MGDNKNQAYHTTFGLFIMIMPGILADFTYKFNCLKGLRHLFSSRGITYQGAFDILSSQTGIVMTMVSLFLTINIHIAERSEKKVFGISRKELFDEESDNIIYVCSGWMSCISPMLFVVSLNIRFCFTGYLLFIYCNLFLIIHFYRHKSSFGKERDRTAVVNRLEECFRGERVNIDKVIQYRMLLENIGNSAQKDQNWSELENMYYSLMVSSQDYNSVNRYMLCYYYYSVIFWDHNKNGFFSIQILKKYMKRLDLNAAQENNISDQEWLILWGMLKAVCLKAREEELSIFFKWFLDFAERSKPVMREIQKSIPISILNQQAGMLSILSEYRLQQNKVESSCIERQMKDIWNYGKTAIENIKYDKQAYIEENNLENDMSDLGDILKALKNDVLNHSKISIITNL